MLLVGLTYIEDEVIVPFLVDEFNMLLVGLAYTNDDECIVLFRVRVWISLAVGMASIDEGLISSVKLEVPVAEPGPSDAEFGVEFMLLVRLAVVAILAGPPIISPVSSGGETSVWVDDAMILRVTLPSTDEPTMLRVRLATDGGGSGIPSAMASGDLLDAVALAYGAGGGVRPELSLAVL